MEHVRTTLRVILKAFIDVCLMAKRPRKQEVNRGHWMLGVSPRRGSARGKLRSGGSWVNDAFCDGSHGEITSMIVVSACRSSI